jgi:hypothetical protein
MMAGEELRYLPQPLSDDELTTEFGRHYPDGNSGRCRCGQASPCLASRLLATITRLIAAQKE